jgi:hypothetical protein
VSLDAIGRAILLRPRMKLDGTKPDADTAADTNLRRPTAGVGFGDPKADV